MITRSQAQSSGLIELTYPSDPSESIETQYGRCTVQEWLIYEMARLLKANRVATVAQHNGLVSLWVNPIARTLELVN